MKSLLIVISLFSGLNLASAKSQVGRVTLSFQELKQMPSTQRNKYLRQLSQELILFSPRRKVSWDDIFFSPAHAQSAFRCVGGGVPVPAGGSCGVSSYAGFSCPDGQLICNPLLFGVRNDGSPVCHSQATTEWCFQNTRVGRNTSTDIVFERQGAREAYAEFSSQIEQICNSAQNGQNPGIQMTETLGTLSQACQRVARQTEVNRTRQLVGYRPSDVQVSQQSAAAADPTAAADVQTASATTPNAFLQAGEQAAQQAQEQAAFTADPNNPCRDSRLTSGIPRNQGGAVRVSATSAGSSRDGQVLDSIRRGQIPDHLRNLVPVRMEGQCAGQSGPITICVMPDYLSVGTNGAYERTPLGMPAATEIAEELGFILPTTRMVDQIYSQATVRLSPSPMDPNSSMGSTAYYQRHNQTIQGQLSQAGYRPGSLVAGHKKDLVVSNRLVSNPGRVAIYGWHQRNGRAIQPLSTVHGANYADYSHGVRLISQFAFVGGRSVPITSLMRQNCPALNGGEGPINGGLLDRLFPAPQGGGTPARPQTPQGSSV